jgi:hypothetical protein
MSILIFVLCYISNFSFGVYYNTKILSQKLNKTKLKNAGLKLIAFIIGLTCLSIASYLFPIIAQNLGLDFELDNKAIAILFGTTSVFYASQALVKLKDIILKNTNSQNTEERSEKNGN